MSDAANVAMNFPRRDARDKLRGRTRYTVDRARPGMLHATLARAQVPSARIVRIDTSAARRMPGVRAIVTGADAPFRHGIGIADHPLFAMDRIRYDGEPIAAIAADTLGAGASGGGRNRGRAGAPPRGHINGRRLGDECALGAPGVERL